MYNTFIRFLMSISYLVLVALWLMAIAFVAIKITWFYVFRTKKAKRG